MLLLYLHRYILNEHYNCTSSIPTGKGLQLGLEFISLRFILRGLMNFMYIFLIFCKSIFMFYLYMIQTTCVLQLDGFVLSGQEEYTV